ncbi:DNA/RNA nuclease SfsA [Myxacorys almedinensis]|uniref:Sugar fermentation stimulation protein homolog n=1 Tax=Myxacorys almedinensis A TaxID=2690445 RepID=A0A8J7YXS9_9CYAN|nr:DNA/RNA nuclease SfsA [Myxacorys almedinensis]NDJ16089.1 DNA/RNA nuclease SfsA [Myxacorys almedinensis A]
MTFIYHYPPLYAGTLLTRYKRFFADVQLDSGEIVTAHCPNTGPMTGIYLPGHRVQLSHSTSPTRKLAYTWEMVEVNDNGTPVWVGVNTGLPNRVIKRALEQFVFPELGDYGEIRHEVPYGQEKSRVDFLLTSGNRELPIYIEVKSTTWAAHTLALFPDCVTTRGQKHIRELTALLPSARAVMLYFINRGDCDRFAPGDLADPTYGQLLRTAIAQGLEVLPCRFEVNTDGIRYLGLATLAI